MTAWAIIGQDGDRARAFCMRGAQIERQVEGPGIDDLRARLDPEIRVFYGLGLDAPDEIPAALCPQHTSGMPGLIQRDPPDRIDAWARFVLLGLMRHWPGWDGVVWWLSPHINQWVHVSAAEVVSVQSFLTPRLCGALGGNDAPMTAAAMDTLSRPERLAAHIHGADIVQDKGAITGHLLGAELAAARPYWLGQSVALVTSRGPANGFALCLEEQGVPVTQVDAHTVLPDACMAVAAQLGHQGAEP